eukprot:COSAG01_NODE_9700_length_2366_cov_11.415527_5_plen_95_part_00
MSGSDEYFELLFKSPHVSPDIKGIRQFFRCRLHIKFERQDDKNNVEWFNTAYEKGWIDCMIAHRNACVPVILFDNFDAWLKDKDAQRYERLITI